MRVLALDPSTSSPALALAMARGESIGELIAVWPLRLDASQPVTSLRDALHPILRDVFTRRELGSEDGPVLAVSEWAPPVMRDDVARSSQAEIGQKLGVVSGAYLGAMLGCSTGVGVVPAGEWFDGMIAIATQLGYGIEKPTRASVTAPPPPPPAAPKQPRRVTLAGNDYVGHYRCGHTHRMSRRSLLVDRTPWPPCPACSAPPPARAPASSPADAVRDARKAASVAFARRWSPDVLEPVIADARSRAKPSTPDHRLRGVADAADAACVALHALHNPYTPL